MVPCLGGAFLLHGVARGGFPRFSGSMHRYDSSPLLSLCISRPFARRYRPTLPFASAEKARSPRFLGNPVVRLPCSQTPVGPPRLASRTTASRGVAVSAFRLRASFRSSIAVHAASRRVGAAPEQWNAKGPGRPIPFRGSITRPSHSLSTLRGFSLPAGIVRPRKTRFRLLAKLYRAGLDTRRVTS
jgi:hypothetical protein